MATSGLTVDTLVALGVTRPKAEQTLKNKSMCASIASILEKANALTGSSIGQERGKGLFELSQKLKAGVSTENRDVAISYICRDALQSPEQLQGAIAFVNNLGAGPLDVKAFEAAAGVGVVVTDEQISEAVAAAITALAVKPGVVAPMNVVGAVMKHVRGLQPFASGSKVKEETDKQLAVVAKMDPLPEAEPAPAPAAAAAEAGPAEHAAAPARHESGAEEVPPTAPHKAAGTNVGVWDVEGDVDYNKLIEKFGCQPITPELRARFERLKLPIHHFLKRGIFFSHRELDFILDRHERGEAFYLYTGRGPSSGSMHVGHLVPFLFTKYLQDAFGVKLVIQMTDDEKYLVKSNLTLDDAPETGVSRLLLENAKDIMALGFDPERTFIFSDLEYMGGEFYKNVVRMQKKITINQALHCFGLPGEDNIGKLNFCAIQAAPSFSSSFPHFLGPNEACLVPCAIDQDPYFRLTRDAAPRLGYHKPSLIHSKFFPAMTGAQTKMSSSTNTNTTIFLTDDPASIADKIKKHAFSGAPSSLKEHQEKGANLEVDVAYQYLTFFLEDDAELERLGAGYKAGTVRTVEVKDRLIAILQDLVAKHQAARAKISDADVREMMNPARFKKSQ